MREARTRPIQSRMKQYGTSYYYATLFFPRDIQKRVMKLYAFVRIPDLVVDQKNGNDQEARNTLLAMRSEREKAYTAHDTQHQTWGIYVGLFYECNIPLHCSKQFRDAMLMDTERKSYTTYAELQQYMHGSACVVGEMMCYVIGCNDIASALPYAYALGEAMQLTNFLRDVREDYLDLHRIYMPLEDMQRYGLAHKHIQEFSTSHRISQQREAFIAYEISRCDALYQKALTGLSYLPHHSRKPVLIASKLYQRILRRIEHHHYNVFITSMRTTKREKLHTLFLHW